MQFAYFDLRNKRELRIVKFNKNIDIVGYDIFEIREVKPNVYLIVYTRKP